MTLGLLETFRALSSFAPPKMSLAQAPWDAFTDWALENGLAPLAAYNLEYRMAGAKAPDWVRDRLLSIYQGSVNDNVMKLVAFKRAVDELEGVQVLLLGGASFAEALYPHVGFRPVLEVKLGLRPAEAATVSAYLARNDFRADPKLLPEFPGAFAVATDGRTPVVQYTSLLGPGFEAEESALFARALPMRVYGPAMFRPDLEDALLLTCLEHAQAGYEVPALCFVDVRELVLGAPSLGGPYSRPVNPEVLLSRAKVWKLERALYTSLAIVERLFPETESAVAPCRPALRSSTRRLLETLIVQPACTLGPRRPVRGAARLRKLLAGR
jgi:hypothetical protein